MTCRGMMKKGTRTLYATSFPELNSLRSLSAPGTPLSFYPKRYARAPKAAKNAYLNFSDKLTANNCRALPLTELEMFTLIPLHYATDAAVIVADFEVMLLSGKMEEACVRTT